MLVIRRPQLQEFEAAELQRFMVDVADVLRRHFVPQCSGLGATGLDGFVARGLAVASDHGLTTRQQMLYYLGLMLAAGVDFVERPEPPWATALLAQQRCSPMSRLAEIERALTGIAGFPARPPVGATPAPVVLRTTRPERP